MIVSEKQHKQILKVIKKLAYPKTFIIYNNELAKYTLFSEQSNNNAKPEHKHISYIDLNLFRVLKSQGLISDNSNNKWVINKEGNNFLKRSKFKFENYRRQHQKWSQYSNDNSNKQSRNSNQDGKFDINKHFVNDNESPLSRLAKRKDKEGKPFLYKYHIMAGEKLRSDFTISNFSPSLTTNWDISKITSKQYGGTYENMSDIVINAKNRFRKAINALEPDIAPFMLDICCYLIKLEEAEKRHRLPVRSGKIVLKIGLSTLARHYGYMNDQKRKLNISHFGVEGYVPSIK